MRIQHNIMAMNAYRNYNNNTSALSKNLEKLSSGYKINRAGDDAAGLAISEKMRAQITGLNAAQKNVKDGVSLVKTAEGAMQEIQDMLNRMDYLATQSANGTYDNEVDRANLQKEVDALKTEINRIADSANFNGIKLLDGSLEDGRTISASKTINLPEVGDILATNTILHKDAGTETTGTTFSVDLHDTVFANQQGDKLTLTVGDGDGAATMELSGAANVDGTGEMDGAAIAAALAAQYSTVEINGQTFNVSVGGDGDDRLVFTQASVPQSEDEEVKGNMNVTVTGALGGQQFIEGTTETGKTATVQNGLGDTVKATIDWTDNAEVDLTGLAGKTFTVGGFTVTLTKDAVDAADNTKVQVTDASDATAILSSVQTKLQAQADADATAKAAVAPSATNTAYTAYTNINVSGDNAGAITITSDKTDYAEDNTNAGNWDSGTADNSAGAGDGSSTIAATDKAGVTLDWAGGSTVDMESMAGKKISVVVGGKTVSVELVSSTDTAPAATDNTKLQLTAGGDDPATVLANIQTKLQAQFDQIATDGAAGTKSYVKVTNLTLTGDDEGNVTATADTQKFTARTDSSVVKGDHNFQTTDIKDVSINGKGRLAGTFFDFTKDMIQDNATITIGGEDYTFTTDKKYADPTVDTSKVYIGDLNSNSDDYVDAVGKRLTDQAGNNKTWTVGYNNGKLSFEEIEGQQEYTDEITGKSSLTTKEAIAKTFGWTGGSTTGKALTLQIGDTADEFNQMKVSVGDMHTSAMGTEGGSKIADIDISTQDGAAKAVQVIKDAINYVSGVRGDLGAIQNRLEHTQNNLSVMAENIQDAESTIRDTDVAEEMMSYVKNNILVQSAQAMLAQANQVPQGVLQLLG